MKKVKLTCASGDDKLLQTQVYVQILLKHWKLEIEKKTKNKRIRKRLPQTLQQTGHVFKHSQNNSGYSHVYLLVYEHITEKSRHTNR